jgi:GDP-D-mannose 3',5'-epimerase
LNVGNERTTTIKELAETIVKASGKKIEIKYDKSKPVGPLSRIPYATEARQILGWNATSSIEICIRKTFDWMEQRMIGNATRSS